MKSLVKTGRTIDEAIEEALAELDLGRDDVGIDILEHPNKGLFGLIGAKDALVKVTVTNDPVEIAENFLDKLFRKMVVFARIVVEREESTIHIDIQNVNEDKKGIIIGKRGKTLDSLQYLVSLVVNRDRERYVRVILDIEGYRQKREETLIRLAKRMADKAKSIKKKVRLEPMNPYERRIIHSALQGDSRIVTHSEGEDPYRRVIIELK